MSEDTHGGDKRVSDSQELFIGGYQPPNMGTRKVNLRLLKAQYRPLTMNHLSSTSLGFLTLVTQVPSFQYHLFVVLKT